MTWSVWTLIAPTFARSSKFTIATLTAVAIGAGILYSYRGTVFPSRKLNVLIVSACSVRGDRLGVYNPESKLTPGIDAWANGSYVFTNAVAELPWQNFGQHQSEVIRRGYLSEVGYPSVNEAVRIIIPPLRQADSGAYFWGENDVLNYSEGVHDLKKLLKHHRKKSFFFFVHLKYMHFPYVDRVNMGEKDFAQLSPRSRELLARYSAHPERYTQKLPLLELLFNDFELLKKVFKLKTDVFSAAGIVSGPEQTAAWRRSPDFDDDVKLASELYSLKMRKFDEHASDVLDLFGSGTLRDNTIVIFMGDHGEAMMEHGVMGHSVNVYDEMLRYPMIVKFPAALGGAFEGIRKIEGQINHSAMVDIVKGILEEKITAGNFEQEVRKHTLPIAQSRNCTGSMRSARLDGEWKLIKNLNSDTAELYNLKNDPHETKNVAAENPEIAWKLDEYLLEHPLEESLKSGTKKARLAPNVCQAESFDEMK
jgi:hypothetical protein